MQKDADVRLAHLVLLLYASFLVVYCLSLASQFFAQSQVTSSNPQATANSTASVKVDVELVLVNATVTDASNRFVTGLAQEHFQIFEDKVQQKISQFSAEEIPVSIGLLFDVSSSMGDKIARAKDAAIAFLKTTNPEDEFFLLTFADQPKIEEEFTSDISEIQNRLAFARAKGSTTLYDAVYLALRLSRSPRRKSSNTHFSTLSKWATCSWRSQRRTL
jgi:Ca-activated chloride channel family protein